MSKILYEEKGRIAYITLNRPPLNVIDLEMVKTSMIYGTTCGMMTMFGWLS